MKKAFLIIATIVGLAFSAAIPLSVPAFASQQSDACDAIGGTYNTGTKECTTTNSPSVDGIAKTILKLFTIIVGITAVFMIIVGGFKYITSGGDSNKATSAKNTIMYAIIGLVITGLAQFIVQFVIQRTK